MLGQDGKAVEIELAGTRLGLLLERGVGVGQRASEAEGLAEDLIGERTQGEEEGAVVGDETAGGLAVDIGHAGVAIGIEDGLLDYGLDEHLGHGRGKGLGGHLALVQGGDDGMGDEGGVGGGGVAKGDGVWHGGIFE